MFMNKEFKRAIFKMYEEVKRIEEEMCKRFINKFILLLYELNNDKFRSYCCVFLLEKILSTLLFSQ